MELIFLQPHYLFFLLFIPVFVALFFMFKKRTNNKNNFVFFANYDLLKKALNISGKPNFIYLNIFRLTILMLLIIVLSQPVLFFETSTDSSDYIFILDTSISMLVEDVQSSRIDLSKNFIQKFILNNLSSSEKYGLITYSTNIKIEQDLTNDEPLFLSSLEDITVIKKSNAVLSDALIYSTNLLLNSSNKKIVLFTDSLSDEDLSDALHYCSKKDTSLVVFGVGTEVGAKIPQTDIQVNLDKNLELFFESLNIPYYNLRGASDFSEYSQYLVEENQIMKQSNLFEFLLIVILFLCVLKFILLNTIFKLEP